MALTASQAVEARHPAAGLVHSWLLPIAVAWGGYWLIGRLSLLLAIPPGYATPVWPAAGLALAALLRFGRRASLGVALGSFCLNLPTALVTAAGPGSAVALVTIVAIGAALQALLGHMLIRRYIDDASSMTHARELSLALALGGPVACLVAATNATAALHELGVIALPDVAYHWLTWWVGDTIGVLVVLPIYLTWTAPKELLAPRRKLMATLPILVLLALVTLLFVRTSALEQQRIVDQFVQRTDRVAHGLRQKFAEYNEVVHAIADYQTATESDLDRQQFRRIAADMLARHPDLYALSWNPYVGSDQRAAFEQAMRDEGLTDFEIHDLASGGRLVRAAERPDYFPIAYIEPQTRNARALGFDLASERTRRSTLQQAGRSGTPTATPSLHLVQAMAGTPGIVVMQPAYWRPVSPDAPPSQRTTLRGYASAVLLIDPMMRRFVREMHADDFEVRLLDGARPAGERELVRLSGNRAVAHSALTAPSLARSVDLDIGQHPWTLHFALPNDYPTRDRSPLAWSVLIAGLLFTGLFSAFLLSLISRTALVEGKVATRTAQLRASQEQSRAIVDTARDAYIAIDEHSRVVDWNREAEDLFGWSADEARGRPLTDLIIPPRHRDAHARGMANYLATGDGPVLRRRMELAALHREGREFPVEFTIWTTGSGPRLRFHAFLHDISERHRGVRRLAAQQAAAGALVQSGALDTAAFQVLQAVCSELGWRFGALWTVEEGEGVLRCLQTWQAPDAPAPAFAAATHAMRLSRGEGLPGLAWQQKAPEWIPDVTVGENFPRSGAAQQDGLRAAFAVPVNAGDTVLGVMEFFSGEIEAPDEGLLAMMDTLGSLLGEFIHRKHAEAALFDEKERAEVTLSSMGDGVVVVDTDARISYLNPIAEAMTGWTLEAALGKSLLEVVQIVDRSSGQPTLNPVLVAMRENRTLGLAINCDLVRRDGHRSPIEDSAAPVHDRNGQVSGAVLVFHDVSESRAMALKMSHLAQHDYLTDLPNRVLMQDRFTQAIVRARRARLRMAVLYMDLDGFKHINDSLGHLVGDALLQQVAERLLESVRSIDTISRQGGDEFVVLLPDLHDSADAARVAEHVLLAMRAPFDVEGNELNITLSIGVSVFPDDADEPGTLLKYADAAMYQAKQQGRNRYRFYTRAISEQADRRLAIESSLHQALRNRDFVLHYQPKVAPDTGRICGMEALVRWRRRDGELVMPGDFIEIAEECGLIAQIDEWVLEEACRQNRRWQDAGLEHVAVAVNLSAARTHVEAFPDFLADVLRRTRLAPECLQIELTEGQMLHDTERFETLIRGIKSQGVKVAIDDFGTGYSSLGYLHRFPFDALKIDKSFVQSLREGSREAAIVEAITRLARAFDYVVVAEGVETHEQVRILQAHGCNEMQGYLYSRPVSADAFEQLLRAGVVRIDR